MTKSELQDTKDFAGLFTDPRFVKLMIYMRKNFPNKGAANGDEWRGFYSALDEMEKLAPQPPKPEPAKRPERLYPDRPMPDHFAGQSNPENQPAA